MMVNENWSKQRGDFRQPFPELEANRATSDYSYVWYDDNGDRYELTRDSAAGKELIRLLGELKDAKRRIFDLESGRIDGNTKYSKKWSLMQPADARAGHMAEFKAIIVKHQGVSAKEEYLPIDIHCNSVKFLAELIEDANE